MTTIYKKEAKELNENGNENGNEGEKSRVRSV